MTQPDDNADPLAQLSALSAAVSQPASATGVQDGIVVTDVVCQSCGYNLRTQRADGFCPECGAPVVQSLHGDALQYSDPAWLGRLRLGIILILTGVGLHVLFSIAVPFVALAAMSSSMPPPGTAPAIGPAGMPLTYQLIAWGAAAVTIVLAVMEVAGTILLTTPERHAWRTETSVTLRASLRVLAIVAMLSSLLSQAGEHTGIQPLQWAGMALWLAGLARFIVFFLFLARLALRIPDRGLARQCKTVMWGIAACWIAIVLISVGTIAASAALLGSSMPIGGAGPTMGSATLGIAWALAMVLTCVTLVALLVFAIWGVVVLIQFLTALGTSLKWARYNRAQLSESLGLQA